MRLHLLVLRCQAGDHQAFADLHREFSARTLRYLKGLMDEATAEDVQQDVWLTVFRKAAELTNPGGFRTWLYRVTRHRAIDVLRRERRRSEWLTGGDADLTDTAANRSDDTPFLLETEALATASLQEIQLRLAALEEMIVAGGDANSDG
jgi:RNA polymerase sigma factor (sigma-70 family)